MVIPSLGEAENLRLVLPELDVSYEVIVVEGKDPAGTRTVAQETRAHTRIIPQTRRGKGNAMLCGCHAANGRYLVMFDADGSADPTEIPRFIEALKKGADFAKGSRFLHAGGSADLTRVRGLGNTGLCTLTNLLFNSQFTDLCYGFNAFRAEILPLLELPPPLHDSESLWGDGFEIETLLSCRIARAQVKYQEVPSFELHRVFGRSNLNAWSDGWRVLRTIVWERAAAFQELPRRSLSSSRSIPAA
ncbi:glycosyl transferase [Corynebacterium alimapuense]|uniref:Glycosyl transferase n=1 Tax=Corynebacterium alimapuense TaxID=1576874 RepID=A0A3M8KA28_9CORY|nr:glycosyl transferase [Corynebacterium alimapuense]